MRKLKRTTSTIVIAAMTLASCGGGGATGPTQAPQPPTPQPVTAVFQTPQQENLTVADIQRIISQGVGEAQAQGRPSGFVVIDRVGNVLAVFVMNGTNLTLRTPPAPNGQNADLQNLNLPAPAALAGGISKTLTAAYFSSMGAAFSSRTANDIVQETFPPSATTRGLESGPLFSVQFSQLPCSDVSSRFPNRAGTHRGPLGVGADPGAFPLYKNGVVVGAVGVIGDGVYGFDTEYTDNDRDPEETIALAATTGFEPAPEIRANRFSVDGTLLRYSDATTADFRSNPANAQPFANINVPGIGSLFAVPGYNAATIVAGTAYGSEASGIRPAQGAEFPGIPEAWVLSDGLGNQRYPVTAGTDAVAVGTPLSAAEVRNLLEQAFLVQRAARAQLRYPLDNRAQNTIVVVDTYGTILGMIRGPDALVDAIDAVPQKARTTAFFSNSVAAADLLANPRPGVPAYVGATRTFLSDPTALTGATAFSLRAIGNLSRPWFPDGEVGRPPGPLSVPFERFSIFSTGLQSNLINQDIRDHVSFIISATPDVPQTCTGSPNTPTGRNRINNGITLFAGGVPIYRGNQLVGAIAASGDGDDQSDLIAFLGLYNASQLPGATIGHADPSRRSDRIDIPVGPTSTRLRYVLCPFNPFVGSSEQNVCQGK
jgi:uncharacterized protein GlcG (DUF336 family)